jgi:hypothetical protein
MPVFMVSSTSQARAHRRRYRERVLAALNAADFEVIGKPLGGLPSPGLTWRIRTNITLARSSLPRPPPQLTDPYEISNRRDCNMAAALWTRWQRGELRSYM